MWKKNLLEDLELGEVKFGSAKEFLLKLKKEFRKKDKELVKVTKLERIKQRGKTMKEFMHKFRRAVRDSEYEERVLVKEFKKDITNFT